LQNQQNMQLSKAKSSSYKNPTKISKIKDCPYCKSGLTETEKDFFPCTNTCTFQACIDCYRDIITNKGLCPICHTPLRLEKLNALKALKKDELAKAEGERLLKKEASSKKTTTVVVSAAPAKRADGHTGSSTTTQKVTSYTTSSASESAKQSMKKMSLPELLKVRILQRNLVYVIGLAPKIAKNDILDKFEYFRQYGKIQKIIVNKNNVYNSTAINGPSYSAYITFSNDFEASIAILAVDQFDIFDRTIRASYGTTKYCTFFLRDQACPNPDCLYLHRAANEKDTFMKDESSNNKSVFIDQQKMAVEHLQKHLPDIDKIIAGQAKGVKTTFPSMDVIRGKVKDYLDQNPPPTEENKKAIAEEKKTLSTEKENSQKKSSSQTDQESESTVSKTDKKLGFDNVETESEADDKNIASSKADLNSEQVSDFGGSYAEKEGLKDQENSSVIDSVAQSKDAQDNMFEMQENEMMSDNFTPNDSRKQSVNYSLQGQRADFDGDDLEFRSSSIQADFDKRILRNLLINLNNSQISRFRFAQENEVVSNDPYDRADSESEYNLLYKSIQSQMNIPPAVFHSIIDRNNRNRYLETIQNLINEMEESSIDTKSTHFGNKAQEGGEETTDLENVEKDSTSVNDTKASGSKRKGKNKRRKESNTAQ